MTRIVLLGCAGAGKTTLARRLSAAAGAPVIYLDALWRPEWSAADTPRFRALLTQAHAGQAWISDGNFARVSFDLRLPRADLVVWLERPRLLCAWRALARTFRRGEAHRLADLPKVLDYIWGFERRNRPLIEAERQRHGADVPMRRLSTTRDIDAFVASLACVQTKAVPT